MANSKQENFKRLGEKRAYSVLKRIKLLANLSNRNAYEYSDKQIEAIFMPIEKALNNAKARFVVAGDEEGITL